MLALNIMLELNIIPTYEFYIKIIYHMKFTNQCNLLSEPLQPVRNFKT